MIDEATEAQAVQELIAEFSDAVAAAPLADEPDEVERAATAMLVTLELPDLPSAAAVEVASTFLDALERRGDAAGAGVLAALGLLAREPVAGRARAAGERLAEAGVVSRAAPAVGTLAVREALCLEGDGAELLLALLARPGSRRLQVAMLGVEHEETGGALAECMLTEPLPARDGRALVANLADEGAVRRHAMDAAELAARAAAAARRAVELDSPLGHGATHALPLVALALTGDAHGLPWPRMLPPWEDDDPELEVDPEDGERAQELIGRLLDELERYATENCPEGRAVWRHGDFVAGAMLDWKASYGDGALGRWTSDELEECLLEHFPRKVTAEEETFACAPECAIALLRFLAERGSLSGEPLEQLEETCEALGPELVRHARDPHRWGLAKTFAMRMLADGVDPTDEAAHAAWIADFNSRSRAEREAVLGTARIPAAAERRGKRKAQRAARKRNRQRR